MIIFSLVVGKVIGCGLFPPGSLPWSLLTAGIKIPYWLFLQSALGDTEIPLVERIWGAARNMGRPPG